VRPEVKKRDFQRLSKTEFRQTERQVKLSGDSEGNQVRMSKRPKEQKELLF
jgi:hypothetical protein